MRFNYDLLPGEVLTFEEIAWRYAQRYPEEKLLTARGLLSPSTSQHSLTIRAVFASHEPDTPFDELLFISDDNDRKNYLRRFEYYLQQQAVFHYFRRTGLPRQTDSKPTETRWKVMGESRVFAMLDPLSPAAQHLLQSRGYTLLMMHQDNNNPLWQLFDPHGKACFAAARTIQFIVVLLCDGRTPPAGVMAGTRVGRRVKSHLWQHASELSFQSAVKARYGSACVITGTVLNQDMGLPWVEACHIIDDENEDGMLLDTSIDNGLFLRSDLLKLFISRRLHIDGEQGIVRFRQGIPADARLVEFYRDIDGKACALWAMVPQKTRDRLRKRC